MKYYMKSRFFSLKEDFWIKNEYGEDTFFVDKKFLSLGLQFDMIKNNETLNNIFRGIRPAVVALIIAPVFKTAKVAKIGWKTVAIPIVIALLIWSKLPYVSNPIIFIVLGGLGGYLWLRRQHSRLSQRKEEVER